MKKIMYLVTTSFHNENKEGRHAALTTVFKADTIYGARRIIRDFASDWAILDTKMANNNMVEKFRSVDAESNLNIAQYRAVYRRQEIWFTISIIQI